MAYVVRGDGDDTGDAELLAWFNDRVGKTQRLAALHLVDELPRSAIGKVLKRELRDRHLGAADFATVGLSSTSDNDAADAQPSPPTAARRAARRARWRRTPSPPSAPSPTTRPAMFTGSMPTIENQAALPMLIGTSAM